MSGTTSWEKCCIIAKMTKKKSEPLFNISPNKTINAYDLFDKIHRRKLRNFRFRVGVYGILRKKKEVLVQRHPQLQTYGLPGGGVEIDETIPEALSREFVEETGLRVKVGRLLDITEDFFTFEGEDAHGVLIYYEVQRLGGKLLKDGNNLDTGEVRFLKLSDLNKDNVQRVCWSFVKKLKKVNYFSR